MAEQELEYGRLVEQALRQVVRDALAHVAENGLPGRHHFYITFRTDHPGVAIDPGLFARYPTEMTIVLQNEFWGLEAGADGFAVTLSFGGRAERLEVPYAAISVFADPGVEFGLQFNVAHGQAAAGEAAPGTGDDGAPAGSDDGDRPESGGAEVVTLDRFRKK